MHRGIFWTKTQGGLHVAFEGKWGRIFAGCVREAVGRAVSLPAAAARVLSNPFLFCARVEMLVTLSLVLSPRT